MMLKRNNRVLIFLLVIGYFLAQSTIAFAGHDHAFNESDAKCKICLVAGHLSHALGSSIVTLNIDHPASLQISYSCIFLTIPFNDRCLIRAPPFS